MPVPKRYLEVIEGSLKDGSNYVDIKHRVVYMPSDMDEKWTGYAEDYKWEHVDKKFKR